MRRVYVFGVTLLPLLAALLAVPTGADSVPVVFTHGIGAGDVQPYSAVLWTRIDREAGLVAHISTDPTFPIDSTFHENAYASPENDFVAKVRAFPLQPDTTYYYRWSRFAAHSETGTFKTPPLPSSSEDVRFAFSGDSDGTVVNGVRPMGDFLSLDAARAEGLDFFAYLGDTIYSDSGLRPGGPAMTLDEYRDAYKENREVTALRDLAAATSMYAQWDDHEVYNDFDGQTVDPMRYADGRQAFLDYMPTLGLGVPDPNCAGDPLFRRFRWGSEADIIVLDERSCRSGDAEPACMVELAPGEFEPDLAPTLPRLLRTLFNAILPDEIKPLLQPEPPPGCLDAINDPSRTMLGEVQKQLLKSVLLTSTARFKFVINEVPIQQFFALPYDRWEGYVAERTEVLDFIRDMDIENVVFLTTDIHANFMNEVAIDRFRDPAPIAEEFVTGPIATNSFEDEIRELFGGGSLGDLAVAAVQQLLNVAGVDCRYLDAYSYGLVDVDAATHTATISLKDESGVVLLDQLDGVTPCQKTLGP